MTDYDCLDSFGMREVKFLPPHFFTLEIPITELHKIDTGGDRRYSNQSTFYKDETNRFRNFLEEKITGRYHVAVSTFPKNLDANDKDFFVGGLFGQSFDRYLILGFERESDITLFSLLITYKHQT